MIAQIEQFDMKGNVFNSYELGAELIYRAYPRLRPMIDSRIDSYGDEYFLLSDRLVHQEAMETIRQQGSLEELFLPSTGGEVETGTQLVLTNCDALR